MPVYYGRGTPIEPGAFPSILAVGDSWFWYPLPAGYNLLQQLSDRVLKPAMDRAQVSDDPAFRQAVVKLLIDRIHDIFAPYDDDARRVHLVDSRVCLDGANDWDNELHPNSKGFGKLATGPWRRSLERYGFA